MLINKVDMDKYKLLTKFANDLPQAFDINVSVEKNVVSMKSKTLYGAKAEDGDTISQRVDGAHMFLDFLENYGYEVIKKTKKGNSSLPNRDRK
jgi:hypothetical protein